MAGACGGSDSDEGAVTAAASTSASLGSTTSVPASTEPVGLVALGHSGLTGENSDPDKPGYPALENSWATGTNPEVNSIYQRMVDLRPETEGHVANAAYGGAPAASLNTQAATALTYNPGSTLQYVPTPELVIIQTIDNDLNACPLDEAALARFGDSVTLALDTIVAASPHSRILIISQFGRPDPAFDKKFFAAHPQFKAEMTGPRGECGGAFDRSGEVNLEAYKGLTKIIEAFEAEQKGRCDAFPQCQTDGGAATTFANKLDYLSSDFNHLNVRGQAQLAELIWPVVAEMLQPDAGVDTSVASTDPAD
jgi:hypothetical protein